MRNVSKADRRSSHEQRGRNRIFITPPLSPPSDDSGSLFLSSLLCILEVKAEMV